MTEKENILDQRCGRLPWKANLDLKSRGLYSATQNEGKRIPDVRCATLASSLFREQRHVLQAAQRPIPLDERQVNAVTARIELDLRLGVIFTRFQTLVLRTLGGELANNDRVISYGTHIGKLLWFPF